MRILITGARAWPRSEFRVVESAIAAQIHDAGMWGRRGEVVVVHGAAVDRNGNPAGADWFADLAARFLDCATERHWAKDHPSPRHRNQHMVDLGADVAAAFALSWASGSGMCARMARRAGIVTVDYGCDTSPRDRGGR